MKKVLLGLLTVCVLGPVAYADDAARDWSSSLSYATPSEKALAFNVAQAQLLLRKGVLPGQTTVTTNCVVAGACQNGGNATNINGQSNVNVQGDGNNIGVDINAQSTQTATPTTVIGDIGSLEIN